MTLPLLALATTLAVPADAAHGWSRDAHARAVKRVNPSVVTLVATSPLEQLVERLRSELGSGIQLLPPLPGPAIPARAGSGIVFDERGHVVTTAALISPGGSLRATLADGRSVPARPLGLDLMSDVAVVELEGVAPPPASFRGSPLAPGSLLCVVGAGPATRCSVGSSKLVRARLNPGAGRMHDFLELGAEFLPGSAGAAVVDDEGRVVGMVIALRRGGGTHAVPGPTVSRVAREILETGAVRRGWLGLTVVSGPGLAAPSRGVLVTGVVTGSPAEQAGLRPDDVILRYAGRPVDELAELVRLVGESRPGSAVPILYRRGEDTLETRADLVERPRQEGLRGVVVRLADQRPFLGVETQELHPAPGAAPGAGVRVVSVDGSGPAARAGLRVGDVIASLEGRPVASGADLARRLGGLDPARPVRLEVVRDGRPVELEVQLERRPVETLLSDLPQFQLAFDRTQWVALGEELRALPPDRRRRGSLELGRFLERHGDLLPEATRRQVDELKRELLPVLGPAPDSP